MPARRSRSQLPRPAPAPRGRPRPSGWRRFPACLYVDRRPVACDRRLSPVAGRRGTTLPVRGRPRRGPSRRSANTDGAWSRADEPIRADHPARQPARLLRRRRAGDRDRRAGARAERAAGLCPPRDRPQPARRRRVARQGRGVRRGARRGARRRARGVLGAWRAQGDPGRGQAPQPVVRRRDLPAGQQGPSRRRAALPARPHRAADRPQRPSRGGRHDGPAAQGRRDPGRDRRAGRDASRARPEPARLCHPDHAVAARDREHPRGAQAALPGDLRAAARGHLLRHHQPAAGGRGDRAEGGSDA